MGSFPYPSNGIVEKVKLLGVRRLKKEEPINYLKKYVLGKEILLKIDESKAVESDTIWAYVYLKNKIFVNAYTDQVRAGQGR